MSGRRLAAAVALGILLALVFDLLLRTAQVAVRVVPARVNWEAAVVAKGFWLLVAAIVGALAPVVLRAAREPVAWSKAMRIAGTLLIATPIVWTSAVLLRLAVGLTLAGTWASDGRVWRQPAFYSEIVVSVGPWLLAGSALRLLADHARRHAP